jgi:type VI secretion system secreted protein Hcp
MAQTLAVFMKADGNDIKGFTSVTNSGGLDRTDSIEAHYFCDSVRTAREKGSAMATGRRVYEPIVFRKRIDDASPLIAKALCDNQVIECAFKFVRPNPESGESEHFFTTEIFEGRVAYIKRVSPDSSGGDASTLPEEEIGLVFHTIRWCFEPGGVEHQDNWREQS